MVRSILLSLALLPAVAVSARSPLTRPTANTRLNAHRQLVSQLLNTAPGTAQKTTTLSERVIAVADTAYSHGTSSVDSTTYSYTGSHGSTYDYNNMEYNLDYPYNYYPMFNFVRHINKPMVICDTVKEWFQHNGVYAYQDNQVYNYDANSNIIGLKYAYNDSANFTNYHYVNTFNGNNDVVYSLQLRANGMGGYDSSTQRFYSYDGQGHITEDSSYSYNGGMWVPLERYTYSYNNGNLVEADEYTANGNLWTQGQRYLMTYTMNNQLQRMEDDYNNNGNMEVEAVDTFGYTNGVNYHTFWKEWTNNGNGGLDSILVERYHLNQQSVPDTIYTGGLDDIMNSPWIHYFAAVTYNSFNDPASAYFYKYSNNMASDTLQSITNYYYQAYTNGVANTAKSNVSVYPSPTTGTLNVQLDNTAASSMTLRLINTAGQPVADRTVTGNSAALKMDNLSAGVYWLVILDDKGIVIHRQAVVKQ